MEFIDSVKFYIFLGILTVVSCSTQPPKVSGENSETNRIVVSNFNQNTSGDELVEFFSDESKIGRPHKNKVEISEFKKPDRKLFAIIKFFVLDENKNWKLKQTFEFEKNTGRGCEPKLEDFNNDRLKDLTCISLEAARGANEVRRLYIYDKNKDELIYIKNSEDYPNMVYNKELDCIDAWLFHGGATQLFLRIEGDVLKEFAGIDNSTRRTIWVIDKNGKEKTIRDDKIGDEDIYIRYKNFNPLKRY